MVRVLCLRRREHWNGKTILAWLTPMMMKLFNSGLDVALQFLKTSHEMVRNLLEALLGNLGEELDDSKIDAFIGKKMVNMNFYPTCPNPELTVGVGRHSDMGTLTILLQDGIGGLYVKVPEDVDMEKKGET
ncbi:hypothetical protein Godav_018724 [Gossypium davidsonii]|uniref:Isopenicillin N synthase-like Fe(2+) 2OG dioxygenase domain-containing protein n=1 Tax=Gossypium davidsonii TaxID=34287 RepID=A0A7J8QY61_GOSDV|nr:hypothetical protein [Gossypium davidsonii]